MPTNDQDPLQLPLRTDISPTCHPGWVLPGDLLRELQGSELGRAAANAIARGTGELYRALGDAVTAKAHVQASNDPDAAAKVAAAARRRFDAVAVAWETTSKAAEQARDAAVKRRDAVIQKLTSEYAGEIRKHVTQLDSKAGKFLSDAVVRGDAATVAAVVNAPHFLSGISEPEHSVLLDQMRRKFAGADHVTSLAIDKALGRAKQAQDVFLKSMTKFMAEPPTAPGRQRSNESITRLEKGAKVHV